MNLATLKLIRKELADELIGRRWGKIFQLSRLSFAVDFRLADSRYLFVSVEPGDPRVYLIRRRVRDLEKESGNVSPFAQLLKKHLSGAVLQTIEQIDEERILSFAFAGEDDLGAKSKPSLIVQLTGKSANLFLLRANGSIVDSLKETNGDGQEVGTIYTPPARPAGKTKAAENVPFADEFESLSEALDAADLEKKSEREFQSLASAAKNKVGAEIKKREKLHERLNGDLAGHGDAERWKRFGDLLLANVATAERKGPTIIVTDFFDENLARVEIEADENDSITETAEKFFRRYTKARNAREEIAKRVVVIEAELAKLREHERAIGAATLGKDSDVLSEFAGASKDKPKDKPKSKESPLSTVARSFTSSDGFEILVGKKARDNDYLTFRVAKSLDTWMHAADYPGSHVVIRNPNRKEIPQPTLLEAAQLAAYYSQGKTQMKAAVHYTQKKFVNKPKGAAPGLVSLASFKTLLVEPEFPARVTSSGI